MTTLPVYGIDIESIPVPDILLTLYEQNTVEPYNAVTDAIWYPVATLTFSF